MCMCMVRDSRLLWPWRIYKKGFSAYVTHFWTETLGAYDTNVSVSTGQDDRIPLDQIKVLVADIAMQFHRDVLIVFQFLLRYDLA